MKFKETSKKYSLNKSTYVNLRWIAYIGQLITILAVEFIFNFKFNYVYCISIIVLSVLSNLYLSFRIKENQLNNFNSTLFLTYDILQLSFLFYFTGGITNPFIFLIIIPAVFSSQYLNIRTSIFLVGFTTTLLLILTFFMKIYHIQKFYIFILQVIIFTAFLWQSLLA